jgi:uncharacterized membrane protein
VKGAEHPGMTPEHRVEVVIGALLRFGVLLAAAVVASGAALYLAHHGGEPTHYRVFRGEPEQLRDLGLIFEQSRSLGGRAVIQLGLLLLIATPIARVAFSVAVFAHQRDATYVAVTLVVLGLLLWGLLGGGA